MSCVIRWYHPICDYWLKRGLHCLITLRHYITHKSRIFWASVSSHVHHLMRNIQCVVCGTYSVLWVCDMRDIVCVMCGTYNLWYAGHTVCDVWDIQCVMCGTYSVWYAGHTVCDVWDIQCVMYMISNLSYYVGHTCTICEIMHTQLDLYRRRLVWDQPSSTSSS